MRKQTPPARDREAVLEHRYDLYSRAYDTVASNGGANALLRLYAQALRCRRAAEVISLAESHHENGFPRLAMEHVGTTHGACADCARSSCLTAEELRQASEQPERLIA
jgi:hypothetical protein